MSHLIPSIIAGGGSGTIELPDGIVVARTPAGMPVQFGIAATIAAGMKQRLHLDSTIC